MQYLNLSMIKKNKIKQLINNFLCKTNPSYRKLIVHEDLLNSLVQKIEILLEKNRSIELKIEDVRKNWDCHVYQNKDNLFLNLNGEIININRHKKSKIKEFDCSIEDFFIEMRKYIIKTSVIIDIGCGIRPETLFEPNVHVCIEPFDEYRKTIKPFFPNNSNVIFLKTDALNGISNFDDNSVDTIFVMDVIEHMTKKDGLKLIKEIDRVARNQVIIFTPVGFYPMFYKKSVDKDAWGLGGIDVQEHKSGWTPKDFDKTWDFYVCKDCHESFLPEDRSKGKKYSAFLAIKNKRFIGFPVQKNTPNFIKGLYNKRIK